MDGVATGIGARLKSDFGGAGVEVFAGANETIATLINIGLNKTLRLPSGLVISRSLSKSSENLDYLIFYINKNHTKVQITSLTNQFTLSAG